MRNPRPGRLTGQVQSANKLTSLNLVDYYKLTVFGKVFVTEQFHWAMSLVFPLEFLGQLIIILFKNEFQISKTK